MTWLDANGAVATRTTVFSQCWQLRPPVGHVAEKNGVRVGKVKFDSEFVRELVEQSGMDIGAIARKAGVGAGYLKHLVDFQVNTTDAGELAKVANVLHVPVEELIF